MNTDVISLAEDLNAREAVLKGIATMVNMDAAEAVMRCPVKLGRETTRGRLGSARSRMVRRPSLDGPALIQPVSILLHPALFRGDGKQYARETFLHEVAHLIAEVNHARRNGRWANHGRPWKDVMVAMGEDPHRCANIDAALHVYIHAMIHTAIQRVNRTR